MGETVSPVPTDLDLASEISSYEQSAAEIAGRKRTLRKDEWKIRADFQRIKQERERQLQAMLQERGLGVCAWGQNTPGVRYTWPKGSPHSGPNSEDPLEAEGVFLLADMKMHYRRSVDVSPLEDDDDTEVSIEFSLLCSTHAQNVTESYRTRSSFGESYGDNIQSAVFQQGGGLFREIDGVEVRVGLQAGTPSEKVYTLLGLPPLPAPAQP